VSHERYRVVLDTNQIIGAGARWLDDGVPSPDTNTCRRILLRVAKSHTGLYSGKVVGEYFEKLVDQGTSHERILNLMKYIMGAFDRVTIKTKAAPVRPTDPDDEIFLLCAIDGEADYLVSDDHDLRNLKSLYEKPVIGASEELAVPLGATL
jgi:predicted nucleic acid-binding protein